MDTNDITYFLKIARDGKRPGASGGQRRAATIARFLCDNLDSFTNLDAEALEGVCSLIRATNAGGFYPVQEALEKAGFTAAEAGGTR